MRVMPKQIRLFLTLCLAQGAALAFGFWMRGELQLAFEETLPPDGADPRLAAECLAFVGSWGVLAGVCGLLLLRDQRSALESQDSAAHELASPRLSVLDESPHVITPAVWRRRASDREEINPERLNAQEEEMILNISFADVDWPQRDRRDAATVLTTTWD
jgi:hypothetical protein